MLANIVVALAGLFLVFITLRDVFVAAIVPRPATPLLRPSALAFRLMWHFWKHIANKQKLPERRETVLSIFGPFGVIALLGLWVVLLVFGYGLLLFALRAQLSPQPMSFWSAIYFAGTSFLTIGFGDIVGRGGLARLISLIAGASGLGVVAVVTSYLFSLIGSFQGREAFVVSIGARAGVPPSGLGLLILAGENDVRASLEVVLREGQKWTATLMETSLAYPVITYFRSSHDDESWIATLGTLLDASALLIATSRGKRHGEARFMYTIGVHAVTDLAHYFNLPTAGGVGIDRSEFESARMRLSAAGYEIDDSDASWAIFSDLRIAYARALNALARHFEIPPVAWVSDRSLIGHGLTDIDAAMQRADGHVTPP